MEIDLEARAREALLERNFIPEPPHPGVAPARAIPNEVTDLTALPFSSIDNAESRDLDQVEFARREGDEIQLSIGIADVASYVPADSPVDRHAGANTVSLYTGVKVFPMLPRQLSEQTTSLLEGATRTCLVVELHIQKDGSVDCTRCYHAKVKNHARFTYEEIGAWLEGDTGTPPTVLQSNMEEQLRIQLEAARRLRTFRYSQGALTFGSIEASPVVAQGKVRQLVLRKPSLSREMIESFMIAANIGLANYLKSRGYSTIQRVVKEPRDWPRLREIAAGYGQTLPATPTLPALAAFLRDRKQNDPQNFPDLSLAVVKLLGSGEYMLEKSNEEIGGHFGLAVDDYSHSTAPNRRFADLVTQRILLAQLEGENPPYSDDELARIAQHCTERENEARKVERLMRKVCAASLLQDKIGQTFRGIITSAREKGTYIRLDGIPAEGRVIHQVNGLKVGDKVNVRLVSVDVWKGFIDFATS